MDARHCHPRESQGGGLVLERSDVTWPRGPRVKARAARRRPLAQIRADSALTARPEDARPRASFQPNPTPVNEVTSISKERAGALRGAVGGTRGSGTAGRVRQEDACAAVNLNRARSQARGGRRGRQGRRTRKRRAPDAARAPLRAPDKRSRLRATGRHAERVQEVANRRATGDRFHDAGGA